MATSKFKQESPFVKIAERHYHSSDWKHTNYLKGLVVSGKEENYKGQHSKAINMALCGLGRAGTIHLNNILANRRINLKYIVEGDESKWQPTIDKLNLTETKFLKPEDIKIAYDDPDLEAVLVATPTWTHEDFIVGSLEAGKAVFTEKPVAEEPASVKRCYELSHKTKKPLFCAFNRRFDPSFIDIRKRILDGEIGQVQQIKLTSRDSPLPSLAYLKTSGGIFHDCMVHDIDLMSYILGEYPIEVFSYANALIPEIAGIDDFDNIVSTFKFKSGTIGVVDISRFASYGYDQRLEALGPSGMLQVANDNANTSKAFTKDGISEVPIYWSFPSRYYQGYVNELDHFIDVVNGVEESSVTDRMTSAVTKIAEAAEASARSGKPVPIEWNSDEIPNGYVM